MPSQTIRCRDTKHLVGKYAFYVPVIGSMTQHGAGRQVCVPRPLGGD